MPRVLDQSVLDALPGVGHGLSWSLVMVTGPIFIPNVNVKPLATTDATFASLSAGITAGPPSPSKRCF